VFTGQPLCGLLGTAYQSTGFFPILNTRQDGPMSNDFEGRVALITGATRGIGFGIAQELVSRGARVVITARKPDELEQAVKELGSDVAVAARGSADDEQHQADAVALALERFGRLDHLVNNAAVNPQYGPLMDAELAAVRKVFDVNVTAVLGWTQHAVKAGLTTSILNVASVGGIRAGSPIGAYNASKAALIHLTRQLGVELGPTLRVNAIAPAVVKTHFAKALYEGREDEVAQAYPLKRLGTPTDTAKAAAFLLSDDAGWITGETLVVDGGVTLGH
jgi:NAD(P)-dependent dehydrogenase (short-subunit alcohol dehydrogenase family)